MHFAQNHCREVALWALFRTSGLGCPCESTPFASGHGCLYSFSSSSQGQTIPEQSRRLPDWWGRGPKSGSQSFLMLFVMTPSATSGTHRRVVMSQQLHLTNIDKLAAFVALSKILMNKMAACKCPLNLRTCIHTHNCLSLEMSSQQTVFVSQVFCCLPYYHVRQLHCGAVVPMNITPYVQFEYLGKFWWWGESYFFSVIFFDIFSQLDLQAWGRPLL